ncbi:MAG: TMEM165/GDT1 family protein [Elusimicrobia bacterium]|nr:TMEM165/GDT1 family protein [Elusimicrobiota bacterium]
MVQSIISSFGLVAVSEMGDKTQLLAFSLAARFKSPWAVMAGILVATILNHGLASTFGEWVARQAGPDVMAFALAATFIAFGIWTLKPDSLEESGATHRFGAFLTTAVLFFLAEMGDKTQLATVALAAKYRSAAAVTVGTTLGMLFTDGLAVFLGERIAGTVRMKWIRYGAASLFFLFGIATALSRFV